MDAYGAGRLAAIVVIGLIAGWALWTGLQRNRQGANGTGLIILGVLMVVGLIAMVAGVGA